MKTHILFYFIFLLLSINAFGQPLSLTTSGGPSFPSSNFELTEAGNDFDSNVNSSSFAYLNVSSGNYWHKYYSNYKWAISVMRSDILWNPELILQVKKVDNGNRNSNSGNVNNGKNWVTINNLPSHFIKGSGGWSDIKIDFRVTNFSVTIPADNYQTTIVFTIYED